VLAWGGSSLAEAGLGSSVLAWGKSAVDQRLAAEAGRYMAFGHWLRRSHAVV
jgi:hypothetical protein